MKKEDALTVGKLKELLNRIDNKTVIVVNGEIPLTISAEYIGKISEGYSSLYFKRNDKGRTKAIYFCNLHEDSSGEMTLNLM